MVVLAFLGAGLGGCGSVCEELQAACDACDDPSQKASCEALVDSDDSDTCERAKLEYCTICGRRFGVLVVQECE